MLEAHKYLSLTENNTFMNVCTLVKWRVLSLQTKHVVILFYNFRDLFNNNVTLKYHP